MLPSLENVDDDDASRKFIVLDPVERSTTDDTNLIKDDGPLTSNVIGTSEGGIEPIRSENDTLFWAKDGKATDLHQPESALSQLQKNFKNVFKEVRMK